MEDVAIKVDKDETSAESLKITLNATDPDSDVSHFKLNSLPQNGTLYIDAEMTQAVANYSMDDSGTPFGPDRYTPANDQVSFEFVAKDSDSADDVDYSEPATATITIDDVPYAAGENKTVIENAEGENSVNISGNLLTDGDALNSGRDYQGRDGATLHQIKYIDASGAEQTATIPAAGATTIDTSHGELVVHSDGTYTYTPDGGIDHTAGSGAAVADNFSYTIIDSDGDISNWAEQRIDITDGAAPTISSNVAATVDEKHLPSGSEPDSAQLTKSGDFNIDKGTDDFDLTFDTAQTALDNLHLTSGGAALVYTRSADGHTLTATRGADGDTVFTVTITDPQTEAAGYNFVLQGPLDAGATQADIDLPFAVTVKDDDDGDNVQSTLTVTVIDDHIEPTREGDYRR